VTRLEHRHRVTRADAVAWLAPRNDVIVERHTGGDDSTTATFDAHVGPFHSWERSVRIFDDGTATVIVDEVVDYQLAVPVWGALFRPALRHHLRRAPRTDGRPPWWAPPEALDARAATVLSLLCVLAVVGGYLGTIITQTLTYAAGEFGASTGQQGTLLAVVRIGVLLSLGIITVADRRGRRIVLGASIVGGCAFTALGALAPGMVWLGTTQTFARAFSTVIAILVAIIAVEEMPKGARAFAVSVLTMTAALGAGLCVANLLYVDVATGAWRVAYVLPLLAVIPCWRVARRLPETLRFEARRTRLTAESLDTATHPDDSARPGRRIDWRRFILLSVAGFLWSMFLAPAAQFLNEFLRTERGFSGALIAVFVLATNTPGGIGIVLGGKLADRHGRRVIGAIGIAGGVGFTVIAYLSWGWPLWIASVVATVIGALAVPALAVYGPELFPTGQRGTANGGLQVVGVLGSSLGLLVVGWLADRIGGLGQAMAVVAIAPAILIVVVLVWFPETAHRELEELNPADRVD
jgi:MFS family permease